MKPTEKAVEVLKHTFSPLMDTADPKNVFQHPHVQLSKRAERTFLTKTPVPIESYILGPYVGASQEPRSASRLWAEGRMDTRNRDASGQKQSKVNFSNKKCTIYGSGLNIWLRLAFQQLISVPKWRHLTSSSNSVNNA